MRSLLVIAALLSGPLAFSAEVPFLAGRVNDQAGILSSAAVAELEILLKQHEDSTSNQIAILTISGLEGEDLESYSLRVAETWKLGQADKDNGVLLLVVSDDRMMRIEVGRGLEGALTDAMCGRIIRNELVPRFREGDYDGGIKTGVNAILAAIAGEYTAEEQTSDDEDLFGRLMAGIIFLVVIGTFTLIAAVSTGFPSWFLFFFLIPFWALFPASILGPTVGLVPLVLYIVGFIMTKIWMGQTDSGKALARRWVTAAASSGSWSSRSGGGWSSSGGGFSGGGGGFSGGGASGRW